MLTALTLLQIPLEIDTAPFAFRCVFVIFLLIVALLMNRDDSQNMNDGTANKTGPSQKMNPRLPIK